MIQLKHFCNASDWSSDDPEAMQVCAERLLGSIIHIQAQYPHVNGVDDLEGTVREIGKFSVISDDELDREVELILVEFPNSSYKKVRGYLTSHGYNIQECRVRESTRRVDPEGVILRKLQSRPVVRLNYKVAGPLLLWHHDGNHKLIV